MVIFILTSQPEIGNLIKEELTEHTCLVFDKLDSFYSIIRIIKEKPELIICDYMMFNPLLFNIYEFLNTYFQTTPLIFYNDPQLIFNDRVVHWKQILTMTKKDFVNYNWNTLIPIFEKVRDIIENPNVSQYIHLMQKPKPIPRTYSYSYLFEPNEIDNLITTLTKEAKNAKMPEHLINLSILLLKDTDDGITLKKLWEKYIEQYSEITINSFSVKLSALKRFLKEHNLSFSIIKIDDKYKMIYKKKPIV